MNSRAISTASRLENSLRRRGSLGFSVAGRVHAVRVTSLLISIIDRLGQAVGLGLLRHAGVLIGFSMGSRGLQLSSSGFSVVRIHGFASHVRWKRKLLDPGRFRSCRRQGVQRPRCQRLKPRFTPSILRYGQPIDASLTLENDAHQRSNPSRSKSSHPFNAGPASLVLPQLHLVEFAIASLPAFLSAAF